MALWLASSATDGKTGLLANVLSSKRMMGGLLRELVRRLMRQPARDTSLGIRTMVADRQQSRHDQTEAFCTTIRTTIRQ